MAHFEELLPNESLEATGGYLSPNMSKLLKGFSLFWLADQVIENWDAVKQGFVSGWTDASKL
jgi:hypothetical protein